MKNLKVFYNEKQSTDANQSFSPSAGKPKKLIEYWESQKYPIDIKREFSPVSKEQYYKVHERSHVDKILACEKKNGFYNKLPEIAAILPWTSGSFLAAALEAWQAQTICMSPTSGFHHATYDEAMGFCTFNGLMIAAVELLERGARKIGILDLDHHDGNGTRDIIERLTKDNKFTAEQFHHYTVGGDPRFTRLSIIGSALSPRELRFWKGAEATLEWLKILPEIVAGFEGCDIVLYQAGADPHVDDPCHKMFLASGALTDEQFLIREQTVFKVLSELEIPIAWNLAGGYQTPLQKVLDIHTITLTESLKVLGDVCYNK